MRATTQELENFRVKLRVEVDASEAEGTLSDIKKQMARQARLPGFRAGKVPVKVLEARMGGAQALRLEAIREALPNFYTQGVQEAAIDPIDTADLDFDEAAQTDELIVFEATVLVRPQATVEAPENLSVVVPSPIVTDDEVEAQLTRTREADGILVDVDRPLATGDFSVINLSATVGEEEETTLGEEMSYQVGSASLVPELDEHLVGLSIGDTATFVSTPAMTGVEMTWKATVVGTKERQLPDLTDEWVADNTDHESVGAWRDAIREQLAPMKVVQAQFAVGDAIRKAVAELVDDGLVLDQLRNTELGERIDTFNRQLQQQQIPLERYLMMVGMTQEQLIAQLQSDAEIGVKVDLALRAIARDNAIVPSEDDIEAELAKSARSLGTSVEMLRSQIEAAGRMAEFIGELSKSKAYDWLYERVGIVDDNGIPVDRELLRTNQADHNHDHDHDHDHDHGDAQ
jgi:trigger factor